MQTRLFMLLCSLSFMHVSSAVAQTLPAVGIESVTVNPSSTLTPGSLVNLDILLSAPLGPFGLYAPTQVQVAPHSILVDVFPEITGNLVPLLPGEFTLPVSAPLGMFGPGTYSYRVTWNPRPGVPAPPVSTVTGSFIVVSEPSMAAMLSIGIAMSLAVHRTRRKSNPTH